MDNYFHIGDNSVIFRANTVILGENIIIFGTTGRIQVSHLEQIKTVLCAVQTAMFTVWPRSAQVSSQSAESLKPTDAAPPGQCCG